MFIQHIDTLLVEIVDYLRIQYQCHTFILYGSRARGDETATSDYDLIIIREQGDFERECQLFKGFYLDAFIYSESVLENPVLYLIRAKDGVVLNQKNKIGDELLSNIKALYQKGPPITPDWEKKEILIWLEKMCQRAKETDLEGNFRRHWLLHDALECYFKIRDSWYLGPKESFRWLKEYDAVTYGAFENEYNILEFSAKDHSVQEYNFS